MKTEIINKIHGGGFLHLKVFKILNPKKGGGTDADSDSERDGNNNGAMVNKNIKAMIEEAYRRIEEISSDDLIKRIALMKQALEQIRKG